MSAIDGQMWTSSEFHPLERAGGILTIPAFIETDDPEGINGARPNSVATV